MAHKNKFTEREHIALSNLCYLKCYLGPLSKLQKCECEVFIFTCHVRSNEIPTYCVFIFVQSLYADIAIFHCGIKYSARERGTFKATRGKSIFKKIKLSLPCFY